MISSPDKRRIIGVLEKLEEHFNLLSQRTDLSACDYGGLSLFYLLFSQQFRSSAHFKKSLVFRDLSSGYLMKWGQGHVLGSSIPTLLFQKIWHEQGNPSAIYMTYKEEILNELSHNIINFTNNSDRTEYFLGAAGLLQATLWADKKKLSSLLISHIETKIWSSPCGSALYANNEVIKTFIESSGKKLQKSDFERMSLGIAHGMAGVILSLISTGTNRSNAIAKKLCKTLIAIDDLNNNDVLPPYWPKLDPNAKEGFQSAWCNGDVGVGFALMSCANSFRTTSPRISRNLENQGRTILIRGMTDPKRRKADDPFLCHGYASLTQICWRLLQIKKDPEIENLFRRNLEQLISFKIQENDEIQRINGGDQLTLGEIGRGLVLMSMLSKIDLKWDRLYLLVR